MKGDRRNRLKRWLWNSTGQASVIENGTRHASKIVFRANDGRRDATRSVIRRDARAQAVLHANTVYTFGRAHFQSPPSTFDGHKFDNTGDVNRTVANWRFWWREWLPLSRGGPFVIYSSFPRISSPDQQRLFRSNRIEKLNFICILKESLVREKGEGEREREGKKKSSRFFCSDIFPPAEFRTDIFPRGFAGKRFGIIPPVLIAISPVFGPCNIN